MPQSLVIQVGQAGNQIGSRFWTQCLEEHAAQHNPTAIYDAPLATFFSNHGPDSSATSSGSPIHSLRARGIMVDMEVGVIQNVPPLLHELFSDPSQRITATDGSGNNWAVGHHHYGPLFHDHLANSIRKQAEMCDSLQSVFLVHSLGGGTGSGLGTYLAGVLRDEIAPEAYQFATVVAPSRTSDDVVTSPYNAVLALKQLGEYADAVLPVDNEALVQACGG
ncbi:Tubulin/FtsZ, GTPase domain-containing protein [Catenaria anguillulae PL171]|uniref:Tubulin/FtsZ, GTPase domain-containing protein n=1 Tax=Catenaria anguillulae PL171 TaxID=765915 RepID=A0A1Y2HCG4_9FUNG|nr:Tubulin/FtsZ, GTPase domain-containing protein [Catenaria anguillulae PL171]